MNFFSCSSSKINTNEKDIIGIWYPKKTSGNSRVRANDKFFITESQSYISETEINKPIQKWEVKDTIKIWKKEFLKNENAVSLIISRQRNGKNQYNSALFSQTEVKGIKTVFTSSQQGYETIEEAKKGMTEAKFKNINQELFFSEEYIKTVLPTLKPIEDITKEDYIKTLKYARSFEEEIIAFATEEKKAIRSSADYAIQKIAKKLAQKKAYLLGYDAQYLFQERKNYIKKFEGDKEIEKLNSGESKIKF